MITLETETKYGVIYATYEGGTYIHLAFGENTTPIEVIGVFDYQKSEARIANTPEAVRAEMDEWLSEQDDYNLDQYFQRQARS